MIRATAALIALALPATAQTLTGSETATLPRLIASACLDLIADSNGCEAVILLASQIEPDTADLIVLTDRRTDPASAPLLVHAEQTGIGRFAWTQTLTLAWRDGAFVVVGYTRSDHDRIEAASASCDVNLITGDYVIEAVRGGLDDQPETILLDRTGRGASMALTASAWTTETPTPAVCDEAFALIFAD